MSWQGAAAMITSIILGLGVLCIPEAFAQAGWALGFGAMALAAGGAV